MEIFFHTEIFFLPTDCKKFWNVTVNDKIFLSRLISVVRSSLLLSKGEAQDPSGVGCLNKLLVGMVGSKLKNCVELYRNFIDVYMFFYVKLA